MTGGRISNLIQCLRRAGTPTEGPATDAQLLERFIATRDEAAFDLLVRRHGPMVQGVCRRILRDAHDAEDAFQATFLILAQKTASAARCRSAGGWLYTVAYRVALRARARKAARAGRERPLDEPPPAESLDPASDAAWREVRRVIDDEVMRLPDKYRVPFILHQMEGLSSPEVARELGCAVGTVESWLTRARARLRTALARRRLAPTLGLLAALAPPEGWFPQASAAARAALAAARGEAGAVSPEATALAGEVVRALGMARARVALLLLLVAAAVVGAVSLVDRTPAERPARPPQAAQPGEGGPDGKGEAPGPVKFHSFANAHFTTINAVALSPDGKTLVSAGDDARMHLWDVETGKLKGDLWQTYDAYKPKASRQAHLGRIWAAAFSPDGKTIASGSQDGSMKLWEVATREERGFGPHRGYVYALAFSPDGRYLASAGGTPPLILDRFTRDQFKSFPQDPDAFKERGELKLWDLLTGRGRTLFHLAVGRVTSVAFSPDGKTLASGGRDGVRLWDVATGKRLFHIQQHHYATIALAFSPDGKTLAVVIGLDSVPSRLPAPEQMDRVQLVDVASRKVRLRLSGHVGWVTAMAYSPDGKLLATASDVLPLRARPWTHATGEVLFWDPATGSQVGAPLTFTHRVASLAFDARGEILVVGGSGASALNSCNPGEITLVKLGRLAGGAR
jgi:RNA polymerase sigma factor (sigma-70 family)